ncbi:GWxTD domain-containing protein [candidate division KSB1 bacterium]|nr:GWxTD domain-containing protein [candidate division KSB1 bacterium]
MKQIYILLCVTAIFSVLSFAQMETYSPKYDGIPRFYYDLVNVASDKPGLSRLNVYVEIPYDELQFLKSEESFFARYEFSVLVKDDDDNQVDGDIAQEEIIVEEYDQTNSRKKFSLSYLSFHLNPGKYKVSVLLMDIDTKKAGKVEQEVELRNFDKKKLSVSDITIADRVLFDSLGVNTIHPQVSSYVRSHNTELYSYFEIYSNNKDKKDFEINYEIKDNDNKKVQEQTYNTEKMGPRTLTAFKINSRMLSHGKYKIKLEVKQGGKNYDVEKVFMVRSLGMPSTIEDLDEAIDQLKYVAERSDVNELKNSAKSERLQKFEEFWDEHDPTEGTEVNELREEYYRRVEFANQQFSTFRDGWKTDRGMIYIIFGPPNDIERHPFERSYKPYELWSYYKLNYQFLFMDESGFGEYRLQNTNWRHLQQYGIRF